MIEILDKKECCGCESCVNVCPVGCITSSNDDEGFFYPKINNDACIKCGLCNKSCPVINKTNNSNCLYSEVAYALNDTIRYNSASGGLFYSFAANIINKGGYVCGVLFDDKIVAKHQLVDNLDDLRKLQGSKYVQSSKGEIYKKIKKLLNDNKIVLFSGTPCEVAALKTYLNREYMNLYTIDILCHGVPSPKIFENYKMYLSDIYGSNIVSYRFRDKRLGWSKYSVSVKFANGEEYSVNRREDPYMKLFLRNANIRPSCFDCKFKNINRVSDVTIGDAWGVDKIINDIDTKNGVSLVVIQSDKGERLYNEIKGDLFTEAVNLDNILPPTMDSLKSVKSHRNRKELFRIVDQKGFDELEQLVNPTLLDKIVQKLKLIFKIDN